MQEAASSWRMTTLSIALIGLQSWSTATPVAHLLLGLAIHMPHGRTASIGLDVAGHHWELQMMGAPTVQEEHEVGRAGSLVEQWFQHSSK